MGAEGWGAVLRLASVGTHLGVLVVRMALGRPETPLPQVESVVRSEDEVGVRQRARLAQRARDVPHEVVDRQECAQPITEVLLPNQEREGRGGEDEQ